MLVLYLAAPGVLAVLYLILTGVVGVWVQITVAALETQTVCEEPGPSGAQCQSDRSILPSQFILLSHGTREP